MNKSEVVQVYVQLDTGEMQVDVEKFLATIESLDASLQTLADGSLFTTFSEITSFLAALLDIGTVIMGSGVLASIIGAFAQMQQFTSGTAVVLSPMAAVLNIIFTLFNDKLIPALGGLANGIVMAFGGSSIAAILSVIAVLVLLAQNFDTIQVGITTLWENYLKPLWDNICAFVQSVSENLMIIWDSVLKPVINWVLRILEPSILTVISGILGALSTVFSVVSGVVSAILSILSGVIQFVAGVFTSDWKRAWGGIVSVFSGLFEGLGGIARGVVNGIITIINLLIGSIYSAIAGVVNGLSGIVEVAGRFIGANWRFRVPTKPPQIPYLAKGAVLPANRPFLAMVGDQRHGTNVEAPLATIQEAVAVVMNDQVAAMMAGFQAVVQAINDKNATLELDGHEIWSAYNEYSRKAAVVRGGRV